ncbi:pseudouridine-5'-phosphate glycosidase [Pontibacterium granulatum]|uniref:pseudouridine-5'-phosphate glycosidase n=1 Tax=Pontibacterium granulatum TaxID=2036029 RepID=UPI00249BAA80|nr:pseudouridine-5'-phosphate glycosidase [Pontibacterium granulatum]MDI3325585.1 pseudouridine-5'-phosphate glycosidase [Pontibacterium granulatum]
MSNPYLHISPEVAVAIENNRPVVALESTIIAHGMQYPRNVETALRVEETVREQGAIPATIAILAGRLTVGLSQEQIEYLGKEGRNVTKVSRRDIPFMVASEQDGATTVAATMILAAMAGIKVFATGGIGGVHRGAEHTFDISADLQELARSDVAVVCAGVKSILDLGLTLEYLETQGVPVVGYQTDTLPAFYARESAFDVNYRLDSPDQIAAALKAKWEMGLGGGMVIANPIPEAYAMPHVEIDTAIDRALQDADHHGISGKATTPFLLARISELTGGESLESNIQLVLNNARLAAQIAVAYCCC